MKRLSRSESQERTRTGIIEAATKLFLHNGFRSTSLERVAEEAGYTIGAVYSNFASKIALGVAVVDGLYEHEMNRGIALTAPALEHGTDAIFDAITSWAEPVVGNRAWALLETEVAAFANSSSEHRGATAARFARMRGVWAHALTAAAEKADFTLPLDPELLAAAIVGLGYGLGAQRAADPSIPASAFAQILRAAFNSGTVNGQAMPKEPA